MKWLISAGISMACVIGWASYNVHTMPDLVSSTKPEISYWYKNYTDYEPGICTKVGVSLSVGFSDTDGTLGAVPAYHLNCPVSARGKFKRETWVNTYSDGSTKTVSADSLIERID